MLNCCDQNHNNDNNQHIFDFMKVNKAMKKSLIMEHNYLEILLGIFGEWGNCIKDPQGGMVIFWGSLPNKILTILLTLSVAVFTVIFISKY